MLVIPSILQSLDRREGERESDHYILSPSLMEERDLSLPGLPPAGSAPPLAPLAFGVCCAAGGVEVITFPGTVRFAICKSQKTLVHDTCDAGGGYIFVREWTSEPGTEGSTRAS